MFMNSWVQYSGPDRGNKLSSSKLVSLLLDLKKPLGLEAKEECGKKV